MSRHTSGYKQICTKKKAKALFDSKQEYEKFWIAYTKDFKRKGQKFGTQKQSEDIKKMEFQKQSSLIKDSPSSTPGPG